LSEKKSSELSLERAASAAVITLKQVKFAAMACRHATDARKAADVSETQKKSAMMAVMEPLLGIKSESELQALSPEELRARARRRIRQGLVELNGISSECLLEDVIQKSQSRRSVSWKDEFIAVLGESKATSVINDTAESFSYKFADLPTTN
jgi:hypothetical protein